MRNPIFDTLRGLAVLLMVVDHITVVFDGPETIRVFTRFAMPVFMIVSGALWSAFNPMRLLIVALVAVACVPLELHLGLLQPGILTVWLISQAFMPLVASYPAWTLFFSLVSTFMISPWAGYHPGLLVAFLALGRVLTFPTHLNCSPLALVGRFPLTVYFAHLVILSALASS